MRTYLYLLVGVLGLAACGEEATPPAAAPAPSAAPSSLAPLETKLPDLEVRGDGSDRFASCIGKFGADEATAGDETPALSKALDAMQPVLGKCVTKDPPPGKLMVDVDVAADGKGKAGTMHMCGTPWELATCMQQKLHDADYGIKTPRGVTVPIDFGAPTAPPPNKFVGGAMTALQSSLKDLHACLATAQAKEKGTHASASFHLDVDLTGKIIGTDLNPFEGNQDLLTCAATVISKLKFLTQGTAVVRVVLW